jgi:histidine triad (HIT) family protein
MPTIFSRILAGEIPAHFVFQGPSWVAFLDIAPANPGHVLLVPRHEAQFLSGLPVSALAELGPTLARLITAVRHASGAPAVNVLINDGPEAGQAVPHAHVHVIPRHAGDGKHYHPGGGKYPGDEAARMADKLRKAWEEA